MAGWTLGIIGGSGLYDLPGLEDRRVHDIDTPFGAPSGPIVTGRLGDVSLAFLPRHGAGHRISPTGLNSRANIHSLKQLGCTDLLSLSAVGSLAEDLSPGTFVTVGQYIDRTFARESSFFGEGLVAHVSMAEPTCPRLSGYAAQAGRTAGASVVEDVTYLAMEGPQFSTRAESRLYRGWGAQVIGMTGMPEAKLAREAELPYACVGMVTDYDAWREDEAGVEVTDVLAVLSANAAMARDLVAALAGALPEVREASPIDSNLDYAIITAHDARDPAMMAKLDVIAGRALRKG
ncbi:S-methyl-5'-thioadenosine phosphorylase [Caulobacter sp. NIBR1757]|uniref:S-methyl-5'-thioadenosine phosphorylase n=1 Tax=Caulobacter sp. NIBR1757 TaxID=3016000 RepID=UPI0022F037B2|nr:S-methyl-5'-thioadenosine phosphorylase [Caulobacter sp. NIBR1757]WGM38276.1 S-methyl-5'-thioadenosine phosphorylase [Caulobacter sp. NIBR1757]